jgi:hypothetical protein
MIDLLTVIPIWATFNLKCPVYSEIHSVKVAVDYVLCAMNATRILRALRIRKHLNLIEDAVERSMGEIGLTISVMILFSKYNNHSGSRLYSFSAMNFPQTPL